MASESIKSTISIKDWHEMSAKGCDIPMRVLINGVSMYPMVRRNKDYVTLVPRKRDVIRGDVVMFHDSIRERYVLHRVWKVSADNVLTWGDNCFNPDGWMKSDQVWGLAIRVERGKLNIKCDQSGMRKLGILVGHLRHAYIRIRRPFYLLASKVLPKSVKEWLKEIFKKN